MPAGIERPWRSIRCLGFDELQPIHMVVRVKCAKTIAVFGFLALWLAASNHCRLELVPGLGFLTCCEKGEGAPGQDEDCQTDGCAAVEGSFYKFEDGKCSLSAPVLVAAMSLAVASDQLAQPSRISSPSSPTAPPELPVRWQFVFRAAAPPRAPSLVS